VCFLFYPCGNPAHPVPITAVLPHTRYPLPRLLHSIDVPVPVVTAVISPIQLSTSFSPVELVERPVWPRQIQSLSIVGPVQDDRDIPSPRSTSLNLRCARSESLGIRDCRRISVSSAGRHSQISDTQPLHPYMSHRHSATSTIYFSS